MAREEPSYGGEVGLRLFDKGHMSSLRNYYQLAVQDSGVHITGRARSARPIKLTSNQKRRTGNAVKLIFQFNGILVGGKVGQNLRGVDATIRRRHVPLVGLTRGAGKMERHLHLHQSGAILLRLHLWLQVPGLDHRVSKLYRLKLGKIGLYLGAGLGEAGGTAGDNIV